jgi:hypothetical protein
MSSIPNDLVRPIAALAEAAVLRNRGTASLRARKRQLWAERWR